MIIEEIPNISKLKAEIYETQSKKLRRNKIILTILYILNIIVWGIVVLGLIQR